MNSLWTTTHELHFIENMGRGMWADPRKGLKVPTPEQRLAMLEGYRDSIFLRSDWTGIDSGAVLGAIRREIDDQRGRCLT